VYRELRSRTKRADKSLQRERVADEHEFDAVATEMVNSLTYAAASMQSKGVCRRQRLRQACIVPDTGCCNYITSQYSCNVA